MIPIVQNATNAPIQANSGPMIVMNEPITPLRDFLPIAYSAIISGIDQRNKNSIQGIRNEPPPFCAAIRGNRHIFPAPIAIPSDAKIKAHLELNISCCTLI